MAAIPQRSKQGRVEAREYFYHINAYIPPFPIPLSTSQNGFLKKKGNCTSILFINSCILKDFCAEKTGGSAMHFFQYFRCSFSSKIRVRSSTSARVKILSIKAGGSAIVGGASSQGRDYRKLFCLCCSEGNFFFLAQNTRFF